MDNYINIMLMFYIIYNVSMDTHTPSHTSIPAHSCCHGSFINGTLFLNHYLMEENII